MNLWTKRCLVAGLAVGAAFGLSSAPVHPVAKPTPALAVGCDNGGMIGSGTIVCSAPAASR